MWFSDEDAGLLVATVVLHDVGHAPDIACIGFHTLDGCSRFAEMIDLRRGDFDLDAKVAYVRRQAVEPGHGEIFEDDPKSHAGERRLVIRSFLVPEIRAHLHKYVGPGRGLTGLPRAEGRGQPGATFTRSGTRRARRLSSRTWTCTSSGTPATRSPPRLAPRSRS